MKRLLVVVLTLSLVLAVSASAFAAVHHEAYDKLFFKFNNPPITDTWYTTLFYPPHLTASYYDIPDSDLTTLGLDFYLTDQMFAGYRSWDVSGFSTSVLSGSYLFNFGLFIGYESLSTDYPFLVDHSIVSPGYRYGFGKFNYVTASLNYDSDAGEITAYDFDGFYVTDQIKVKGEVLLPDGGDAQIYLDGAYKISDPLCVGGTVLTGGGGEDTFTVGATYTGVNKLILDCLIGTISGESGYAVSGMYKITDQILVGAQYMKIDAISPDPLTYLKARYSLSEKQNVVFQYEINDPSEMILSYEQLFY
jgi:hypothetical protein